MKFNFVGPAYQSQSPYADNEQCINLYAEKIESPSGGKGGAGHVLLKIPGLALTHALTDAPLRCLYTGDGIRVFAVSGATLFELFQDGTFNALGTVELSAQPAQIFANGGQLFVISGSGGYIADGVTVTRQVDACMGGYLDTYFLALEGSQPGESIKFRISAPGDGKIWDALDQASVNQTPDNILSMLVDHQQVLFLKYQDTSVFWDSGNADFPIEPVGGSPIEQGTIAAWSPQKVDNSVMWLGGDVRGAGVVWRMQGYTPQRVSTHAIENIIQGIARSGISINDAVGMVDQVQGHSNYHLSFPAANLTLTYDCATQYWHRRASWDTGTATWNCHKARYHCYAWGKHLVGGGDSTGQVYEQSVNYKDDAGSVLRWLRSSPPIANPGGKRIFFANLFVDCQVGVGTSAVPNPTIMVRHSNDGGNTFGAEQQLAIGAMGQYAVRARQPLCGSGRNRVVEISGSDAVVTAIVDADMEMKVGLS